MIGSDAVPRVSVIVACYNHEQWVTTALDSVLAQTESPVQLIVMDDCSTDNSREVIRNWISEHAAGAKVVFPERNIGLPAILNRAIELASGRYLMLFSADDWLEPGRVKGQADALDADPACCEIAYSQIQEVEHDGSPTGVLIPPTRAVWPCGDLLTEIVTDTFVGMPSLMFRRDLLKRIGPFDESMSGEDFDFLIRAANSGARFVFAPGIGLNLRRHPDSMTSMRAARLAADKIRSLEKVRTQDASVRRLIDERVRGLAVALHGYGYDRRSTARYLRRCVLRNPDRTVIRAAIESHLALAPGSLSPSRRRVRSGGRGRSGSHESAAE